MIVNVSHDTAGICVTVYNADKFIIMRRVGGQLRKTAGSRYIPKPAFSSMVWEGRQAYAAHHCDQCPQATLATHSSVRPNGASRNPRHWSERDDEEG